MIYSIIPDFRATKTTQSKIKKMFKMILLWKIFSCGGCRTRVPLVVSSDTNHYANRCVTITAI